MKIEFQLPQDNLRRLFRVVPVDDGPGWSDGDYPCNGCDFGVFDTDTYRCTKLRYQINDMDTFSGTVAYPHSDVVKAAEEALKRPLEWDEEDIEFYACKSRDC